MSVASSSPVSDQKLSSKKGTRIFYHPIVLVGSVVGLYILAQISVLLLSALYPLVYDRQGVELIAYFESSIWAQFLHMLAIQMVLAGAIYALVRIKKIPWSKLGFKKPKWRDVWYALGGYGYYFPSVFIIGMLVKWLYPTFDVAQRQAIGFEGAAGMELILVYVALAILPPLVEETIFRGYLFSGLRERIGVIAAASVTCVLFGVAHLGGGETTNLLWIAALDTLVLSAILVYLRQQTGSLWAPMILHCIKNSIAFLSLFIFKTV